MRRKGRRKRKGNKLKKELKKYLFEEGKNKKSKKKVVLVKIINGKDASKWITASIAVLGLLVAFSTYYFNIFLHAPTVVHVAVECPDNFKRYDGVVILTDFTNYGDMLTDYSLDIKGDGVLIKEGGYISPSISEKLKEYKPFYKIGPYAMAPKSTISYLFHIYPANVSTPRLKFNVTLEYKTLSLALPFYLTSVKKTIMDCEYNLNLTTEEYNLIK